ncbi:MAG: DMT family transporter [Helicobacteraceae bacterium]|nr:DMT family transporter [Helicobacteraceae bacterium]
MKNNLFLLAIFCAMIAWGVSWPCMKILNEYLDAAELVFVRYALTAAALIAIAAVARQKLAIDRRSLLIAIGAGAITDIFGYLVFVGVTFGAAGLGGAFINAVSPIITYALTMALFRRKAAPLDLAALAIGFSGALLILNVWEFEASEIFSKYNAVFIAAAFLWSIVTLLSARSRANMIAFSFYLYLSATLFATAFTDFGAIDLAKMDARFWGAALFVSVISTALASTLFFLGSKRLGADRVSVFMFVTPASAIIASAIALDERLSRAELVGIALAIAAVYILNRAAFCKPKTERADSKRS